MEESLFFFLSSSFFYWAGGGGGEGWLGLLLHSLFSVQIIASFVPPHHSHPSNNGIKP